MSLAIYFTGLALIAAVAWIAAAPLLAPVEAAEAPQETRAHEKLRRRKEEALAGIRDAEFDFQLGKLSDEDYQQLRARLEAEALAAMTELEKAGDGDNR